METNKTKRKSQNQMKRSNQKIYKNERGKWVEYKKTESGRIETAGDISVILLEISQE